MGSYAKAGLEQEGSSQRRINGTAAGGKQEEAVVSFSWSKEEEEQGRGRREWTNNSYTLSYPIFHSGGQSAVGMQMKLGEREHTRLGSCYWLKTAVVQRVITPPPPPMLRVLHGCLSVWSGLRLRTTGLHDNDPVPNIASSLFWFESLILLLKYCIQG